MNPLYDSRFIDQLFEGVYIMDTQRTILEWNKGAERITGYPRSEVVNRKCLDNILCHTDHNGNQLCQGHCPAIKSMITNNMQALQAYVHHRDGHRVLVNIRTIPMYNDQGQISGIIEVFSSAAEKLYDEAKIRELARLSYSDLETGLFNRRYLEKALTTALGKIRDIEEHTGLLAVRLLIDDAWSRLGQEDIMSQMIKLVASNMTENLGSQVIVTRPDPLDFIVLLPDAQKSQLLLMGNKLLQLIKNSFLMVESQRYEPSVVITGFPLSAKDSEAIIMDVVRKRLSETSKEGKNILRI